MAVIPQPVLMVVADVLRNKYSESDLIGIFSGLGIENEPAPNKRALIMQALGWLNRHNGDALALLGGMIAEFMDEEIHDVGERLAREDDRERIVQALRQQGLAYERGGRIVAAGAGLDPARLASLIALHDMPGITRELHRALTNVESDTSTAVTAACSALESFFKYYIDERSLEMPADQSIGLLWKVVRVDLALTPERLTNDDLKKIGQGIAAIIDGVGALRTHAGAHGEGPHNIRLEPRHARLAVHAAHAVLTFLFETWDEARAHL